MLTATILPPFSREFYGKIRKLEDTYFKPLLNLDIEQLMKYIDKSREEFMKDYGELTLELLRNTDITRLKGLIRDSLSSIINKIREKNLPDEITKPLVEALELEVENELFLVDSVRKEPKTLLILNSLFSDEKSIKVSYYVIFSLYATLFLIENFDSRQYEKTRRLAELALKSAEEKDSIVETLHIMLSPKREERLKRAIKEKGGTFSSWQELERWLLQD